jgi:thiol-disulfide isomerase/thioredoxin
MLKNRLIITGIFILVSVLQATASDAEIASNVQEVRDVVTRMQGGYPESPLPLIDAGFQTLDGKEVKLSDYKGKVVFLNLWATWCPPCKAEMPAMDALYKTYRKKGLVMLAVSQGESAAVVKAFEKSSDYSFPLFVDVNNGTGSVYGTGSIPTTYIIDREGYITGQFVGGRNWNSAEANQLISDLINR